MDRNHFPLALSYLFVCCIFLPVQPARNLLWIASQQSKPIYSRYLSWFSIESRPHTQCLLSFYLQATFRPTHGIRYLDQTEKWWKKEFRRKEEKRWETNFILFMAFLWSFSLRDIIREIELLGFKLNSTVMCYCRTAVGLEKNDSATMNVGITHCVTNVNTINEPKQNQSQLREKFQWWCWWSYWKIIKVKDIATYGFKCNFHD